MTSVHLSPPLADLDLSVAECDGTGEPNIEEQVRGLLISFICFSRFFFSLISSSMIEDLNLMIKLRDAVFGMGR
jgi:hypothetical protein